MKSPPLFSVASAFAAGIILAGIIHLPFRAFWAASFVSVAFAGAYTASRRLFTAFILSAFVFAGGACLRNSQSLTPTHIARQISPRSRDIALKGVVANDPIRKKDSTVFILSTEELTRDGRALEVTGNILVKARPPREVEYGDRLIIRGRLYRVPRFKVSGRLDYREYLRQRGVHGIMSVSGGGAVGVAARGQGSRFRALSYSARDMAKALLSANMSPEASAFVGAIVLGERQDLPRGIRDMMIKSGTVHIIAISGLHVGLIALILLIALKSSRCPRRVRYAATAAALIFYCVMTGASVPAVRATIMALIALAGRMMDRKADILNSLSFAALTQLIYRPHQLFSVSFQLSFFSIASLVLFAPPMRSLVEIRLRIKGRIRAAAGLFAQSCAVWLGLLPFTCYYFDIVSPIAVVANMIVVPYLAILVGSSALAIGVGYIAPQAAHIFFAASEAAAVFMITMLSCFIKIPGAYFFLTAQL